MPYSDHASTRRRHSWHWPQLLVLAIWLATLAPGAQLSAHAQSASAGTGTGVIGTLLIVRGDGVEERWLGERVLNLREGDSLRTDANSRALITLDDGVKVGLNNNTTLSLLSRWESTKGITRILRLKRGEIWVAAEGSKQFEVETPVAIAAPPRDAEFDIEVLADGNSILTVAKGVVEFGTAFGTCPIRPSTASYAVRGRKCTKPAVTRVAPVVKWVDPLLAPGVPGVRLYALPNPPPSLPAFDAPPASAHHKIDRELLVPGGSSAGTWGSVAARLERALTSNGYADPGYYAVPKGFAMISQLERINEDASPAARDRWKIKVDPARLVPFSLTAYLNALLGRDAGLFRVVAFMFTSEPIVTEGAEPAIADAKLWVGQGATVLPKELREQTYDQDMIATALVYEFEIPSHGSPAQLRKPSPLNAAHHLKAAKILQALAR